MNRQIFRAVLLLSLVYVAANVIVLAQDSNDPGAPGGPGGPTNPTNPPPPISSLTNSLPNNNPQCPPHSGGSGSGDDDQNDADLDPVNTTRDSMFLESRDFAPLRLPGNTYSATLAFGRFYSSDDTFGGPLGTNWTHNYNIVLKDTGTNVSLKTWNLSKVWFAFDGVNYTGDGSSRLYKDGGSNFVWQLPHGTQFHFDSAHNDRLARITDREGNAVAMFYDNHSWLTNVTDNAGRQLSLRYDFNGHLTNVVDPLSRAVNYGYDSSGRLNAVSDSLGSKLGYAYDSSSTITTITNGRGLTHQYTYDSTGRVVTETDAMGYSKHYGYDPTALSSTIINGNGNVTTFLNNPSQQYVAIQNAMGFAFYTRDDQNRITNAMDRLGHVYRYFSDDNGGCPCGISGNLIKSVDPLGHVNLWAYETNFNFPVAFTNAAGNATHWSYDSRGNVTNRTDALNQVTLFQYDAAGNRSAITDANHHTYQFGHDQYGDTTNFTDALGNSATFRYDLVGRLQQVTDALHRTNSFNWNVRDQLTQWTNALGYVDALAYDGNGNLTAWTNKLNDVTTFAYNNVDRLVSVNLPGGGPFISFAYDADGNRVAVTNALGNTIRFGYNAVDRLTSITNALGNVWSYGYDADNRLTGGIDPNNHQSRFAYDLAGHLTAVTNALHLTVQLGYDAVGNLTNLVDARDNPVGFGYDPLNRLTSINYAAVSSEALQYDAVGNLTNYVTRAGQAVQLAYNADNRVTQKAYVASGDVLTFGYDAAGQLTNSVWTAGAATKSALGFAYDAAGHLTNETQRITTAPVHNVGYQYDALGRRTRLTYPDASFVTYQYNSNGWLTAILDGGTNAIVRYTYDAAGHRTGRALENSTFTVYNYDPAGQLTNVWDQQIAGGATNTVSRYQYGFDPAGNRSWMQSAAGVKWVFDYDAINQLTGALYASATATNRIAYHYDAAGNRLLMTNAAGPYTNITTYLVNSLDQYTNTMTATYSNPQSSLIPEPLTLTYDANGNLTSDGSLSGWTDTYDSENRLIQAVKMFPAATVVYVYDALGRLIERDSTISGTNRYYYAGWQAVEERNGNDQVLRKYVYGPGLDEPVRLSNGGTNYYYHADGTANVAAITDRNGNKVEQSSYDPYGNVTLADGGGNALTASSVGNRLLFQGRDRDVDTGLYNFRYRYYSSNLGRFVQPDPIRQMGGINLYAFCGNNPINRIDPLGLFAWGQFFKGISAVAAGIAMIAAATTGEVASGGLSSVISAYIGVDGAVIAASGLANIIASFSGNDQKPEEVAPGSLGGLIGNDIGGKNGQNVGEAIDAGLVVGSDFNDAVNGEELEGILSLTEDSLDQIRNYLENGSENENKPCSGVPPIPGQPPSNSPYYGSNPGFL